MELWGPYKWPKNNEVTGLITPTTGVTTLLLAGTCRIIPASKWLITIVIKKSPKGSGWSSYQWHVALNALWGQNRCSPLLQPPVWRADAWAWRRMTCMWHQWCRLKGRWSWWYVQKMRGHMGVSENGGTPGQTIQFNRDFHYKSSTLGYPYFYPYTWNPKQPDFLWLEINWMIPLFLLGKWLEITKHPFKSGCLGFQVYIYIYVYKYLLSMIRYTVYSFWYVFFPILIFLNLHRNLMCVCVVVCCWVWIHTYKNHQIFVR